MDQPAEPITALHRAAHADDPVDRVPWATLPESLVGPGLVIVLDELLQHLFQMPPAKDKQVIQTLAPNGPNPAFGE